jgi:hypothetical protein
MPAGADEPDEIVARDVGRRRVRQRVIIKPFVAHHICIEDDGHATGRIVDERERRDGARRHAQHLHEQLRPAEAQPLAAELLM